MKISGYLGSVSQRSAASAWSYGVVMIGAAVLAITLGFPGGERTADSQWYRLLAQGHVESVIQPLSNRQLGPRLVQTLTRLAPIDVDHGFALLALVSTFICVGGISYILYQERVPLSLCVATALLPVWAVFDHGYLLPDIFWGALLTVFLLCLWRKSYALAAALLFPLYMARESTLLVLLCLLVAGIRYLRLRVMVGAILASAAGAWAGQHLARGSQANVHHLPALVYLLAKVPFNFMENILGVQLWLNTLHLTNPPLWTWQVPSWLHLGGIKVVGICSFNTYFPSWTLLSWMGGFGILPLVLYGSLRSGQLQEGLNNFFLRFCLLYGLLSYVAGPSLGGSIYRLVLYGWPAFLLALPLLWPKGVRTRLGLMIANLLCGWTTFAVMVSERPGKEPFDYRWIGLAILLLCWAFACGKSGLQLGPDPSVPG